MEQIDLSFIAIEEKKKEKEQQVHENKSLLSQFLLLQNNLFKFIKTFSCYEFCLWLKYKDLYINKKRVHYTMGYKKGDLLYVELGANIGNELSYIHPCIVLEEKFQSLFVVPCSSSKVSKAINKKTGKPYNEYLIGEQVDGFPKKTVLIFNNVRWISKTRVVRKIGTVDSGFLTKVFEKSFLYNTPHKSYLLNKFQDLNNENEKKIKELEKIIEDKDKIINQQNEEIENLKLTTP